jgi:hypothetical protein
MKAQLQAGKTVRGAQLILLVLTSLQIKRESEDQVRSLKSKVQINEEVSDTLTFLPVAYDV